MLASRNFIFCLMKRVLLILSILLFLACKRNVTKSESIDLVQNKETNEKTITQKSEINLKEEIRYVIAKTGLIYRDKPKGKRLGKFGFGSKLRILKRTGIFQEIKNEGKLLKGEWVQVEKYATKTYVFDGFISDKEPEFKPLKFKDIQMYLYNKVWVPTEFLKTLNRTKSYSEATLSMGPNNILFYQNDQVNTFNEGDMEETYYKINENCEIHYNNSKEVNLKILSINNSQMLIRNSKGYTITYFNVNREMNGDGSYEVVRDGIELITRKWFAGTYKLTNTQTNKSYNITYTKDRPGLRIFYDEKESFESIRLDYKIVKIINGTYYLKEMYLDEEDEEAPAKFSTETYTLTKINN